MVFGIVAAETIILKIVYKPYQIDIMKDVVSAMECYINLN